jgi:isocitrate dehydrogenase
VRHHHPDEARVKEFGLKRMWKSPNGTIRNILGGVVFREPIVIKSTCRAWCRAGPIRSSSAATPSATSIAPPTSGARPRQADHALGSAGRFQRDRARGVRIPVAGVAMGMYNLDDSIRDFARACLNYGLDRGWPVYLSTKNTILKAYDGRFKDLFEEIYTEEFKARSARPASCTNIA